MGRRIIIEGGKVTTGWGWLEWALLFLVIGVIIRAMPYLLVALGLYVLYLGYKGYRYSRRYR